MEEGVLLVSIITITYNSEKYIEQAILSVLNQTYKNIEYIIIDGGSTDQTMGIVKQYEGRISKIVSEPDYGISDAFNKGIKLASGDIIGIINSDDWYESNAVELIVEKYSYGDVFHGNVQYWDIKGNKTYLYNANEKKLTKEMTINHMSIFIKKYVYEKEEGFRLDYKYAMDYELLLRLYIKKYRFVYINSIIANMSEGGISDKFWYLSKVEVLRAKIQNNISPIAACIYFIKQILKTFLSKIMIRFGLSSLVSWYRKHLSIQEKS